MQLIIRINYVSKIYLTDRRLFIYYAAQIGLVRMCAFMLQTLSSNKEFSVKLNKLFVSHSSLPATIRLYAFNGTYADFLIIVSLFTCYYTTSNRVHLVHL